MIKLTTAAMMGLRFDLFLVLVLVDLSIFCNGHSSNVPSAVLELNEKYGDYILESDFRLVIVFTSGFWT